MTFLSLSAFLSSMRFPGGGISRILCIRWCMSQVKKVKKETMRGLCPLLPVNVSLVLKYSDMDTGARCIASPNEFTRGSESVYTCTISSELLKDLKYIAAALGDRVFEVSPSSSIRTF